MLLSHVIKEVMAFNRKNFRQFGSNILEGGENE